MQITFKQDILMTPYQRLEDIISGKAEPTTAPSGCDMSEHGYTLIGTGEVTATLFSRDQVVQAQIEALNKRLQAERAETQQRQQAILDQISKLQALTFEPA